MHIGCKTCIVCNLNLDPFYTVHMMAQFIILVAALLINAVLHCSAENVYCVTPTATSCSFCPHNSTNCTTLSEYAREAELYFTSNTTMVFLPGDHDLDTNITVANVIRLTVRGESSSDNMATVVCNGSVGLSFTSMVDFKLHSLAFTSCSRDFSDPLASKHALLFDLVEYAELVNCSFHGNSGTALVVINTNITLTGNTNFTRNHCEDDYCVGGGGIAAVSSNLTFIGDTMFIENSATFGNNATHGAAGIDMIDCSLTSTGSIHFINNTSTGRFIYSILGPPGAIWASASSLHFTGYNNFIGNSAIPGIAGAIAVTSTSLSFTGSSEFNYNFGVNGGAIYAECDSVLTFSGTNIFIGNTGWGYGSAIIASASRSVSVTGTNIFNNNWASYCGAIAIFSSLIQIFCDASDTHTILDLTGTNNFSSNSAGGFGGGICMSPNTSLSLSGTSHLNSNSGPQGGAIYAVNAILTLNGTVRFTNNEAKNSFVGGETQGGAICALNTTLTLNGTVRFTNNEASNSFEGGGSGGGVYLYKSTISILSNTTVYWENNRAYHGGAICINDNFGSDIGGGEFQYTSTISTSPDTTVYWENNHGNLGGAIFVDDSLNPFIYCTQVEKSTNECFFQLPSQNLSSGIDSQFVFKNNSADAAGSVLYGGAIDYCTLTGLDGNSSGGVFDMLVHIDDENTTSNISSYPFRICHCESDLPNCDKSSIRNKVYPGETFTVSVAAVGQRNGKVAAEIRSNIYNDGSRSRIDRDATLLSFQYSQQVKGTCTTLNYTIFSLSGFVILGLYADFPCSTFGYALNISLTINQTCPPGFIISESERACTCEQRLQRFTNSCNITSEKITRESDQQFWVGYNQSDGLILHPNCPFDYCVSQTVDISLNDTDIQCAHNRSGLLCGACEEGYSLVLGTSQCWECTNTHLAWLVLFAVMGIALVFLLLVCKLTVATGTLSALVFYANIVGVNRTIFLPVKSTNILSVFIAWLNLDFGIDTCFFDGMDAYSKTWLQFVFPAYLWLLVGLMILISHHSSRFANLLGNNPVSVLATLILLSYTKILRTLIAGINVTYLEYPDEHIKGVWLYDANIDYLGSEHIPLFIVAVLVFLFLFLPYTLLLLFGQWLQAISHLRLFSWVNSARLKPFMDSYHAPYKAKHRYWPGLLLVLRFALLLVLAFNPQQDPSVNLLSILVGTGMLIVWAWVSGGVYRNWCLDALEGSFALNLIVLAAATYHIKLSTVGNQSSQLAVGYTSVSIALATFVSILTYHIFLQVRHTKLWEKVPKLKLYNFNRAVNDLRNPANNPMEDEDYNQLRESLLDDQPRLNYSAL